MSLPRNAVERVEVAVRYAERHPVCGIAVDVADLREVVRLARERDRIYEDLALYNKAFMRWLADGKPLGPAPKRGRKGRR